MKQLSSILSQLSSDDEIIISDDGSTDSTLDLIRQIGDSRIKIFNYVHTKENLNANPKSFYLATANFFNALKHAKGDVIFLSDQDDIWCDGKVEKCLAELKDADFVKHSYSVIDENNSHVEYEISNYEKTFPLSLLSTFLYLPFRGCCLAFNRRLLELAKPFPTKCIQHDNYLGVVGVLNNLKYKYLPDELLKRRVHQGNVSEHQAKKSAWYRFKYRTSLFLQAFHHIKH